jgi:hypothetical protein
MSEEIETNFSGSKSFINKGKIRFWFIVSIIFGFSLLIGILKQILNFFGWIR